MSLVEIATHICGGADATAKPVGFYAIYDRYFGEFSGQPIKMLELGVHVGDSLKVWASYFPEGTIIGLDLRESPDFSDYSNIVFERGDQTDSDRLKEICLTHAADGLDIVLDDASHIGEHSAASYRALFPYLKPGGLYIIEDWGTGYLDDWPDGAHFQKFKSQSIGGMIPMRIASHDFGMVGFVKSLVDEVAGDHIKPTLHGTPSQADTLSFIHFYKQMAILKKC